LYIGQAIVVVVVFVFVVVLVESGVVVVCCRQIHGLPVLQALLFDPVLRYT
jgi:hypothetical protein